MSLHEDTITAIATPIGQAGIGIVRVSGPLSHGIAERIFKPTKPVRSFKSHLLYLGNLCDPATGSLVDEVLLSYMKAPHSYTREDVIEINSHSGYLLLTRILQIVLDQGARLARPGEFTLRAFLNGRIDLTQAEAVVDLINSQSERGLHLSSQQIRGTLSRQIDVLREKVVELLAHAEAAIDYPDEELEIMARQEMVDRIQKQVIDPIETLIEAHAGRKIWVDGIPTMIVGSVNVGKSSLLNRLLNEQRAIVTPVPGTTRDIIESTVTVEGIPLRLMDTAGFREAKDDVERIGIRLVEEKLAEADLLLVVIDQSRPLNRDDRNIIAQSRGKDVLVAINKIDLPSQLPREMESEAFSSLPVVKISALTGEGLGHLKKAIAEIILHGDTDLTCATAAPNLRHRQALENAAGYFRNAARSSEKDMPMEILALEMRSGLDALNDITGETATEDILDKIFTRFCIGK